MFFVILPMFRSESGQNMTAESDCHASGPPPNLKMNLLQAMEDFVRAWLRSESTLLCKKRLAFFLSPAGMSVTKLSRAGNNLIIPGQESFVSDIPAGYGKTANLLFTLYVKIVHRKGLFANSSHHFNFAFGMRYQTTAVRFELRYFK